MSLVLLVDDNPEGIEYLTVVLRANGFEVDSASDGAVALAKARTNPPAAVIADLLMPVMDGYTLLHTWHADPALKDIPFLVYTATYTEPKDGTLALDLGANAFLIKPQEPEVIVQWLREALGSDKSSNDGPVRTPSTDETDLLKRYSGALFRKLEDKTAQLDRSNHDLQRETSQRDEIAHTQIAILNALPAHIAILDGEGMIIAVNESWRRNASANPFSAPDFGVGQSYLAECENAVTSDIRGAQQVIEGVRSVLRGDTTSFVHEYCCQPPAEGRWFRMMVTPLRGYRAGGAIVMHIDVSDRKVIERRLRVSQEQYLLILNSTAEGIYGLDMDGTCTFCNPAAARLLGLQDPDELLGRRAHDQHHHSRADGSPLAVEDCRVHGEFRDRSATHGDREVFSRKDGSQFPVEYWSHPIVSEGEVIGAVVTFLDISERRNLEAQFQQSQKLEAIGRLAGGVAHDFNNALQVVLTCSELLDELLTNKPREQAYITEIQAAGKQGAALTRQLLAFSRKQLLHLAPLDMNVVILGIESLLRRMVGNDIRLSTTLDRSLSAIAADMGQVEQILMNLAANARDAMPTGGELFIDTSNVEITDMAHDGHRLAPAGTYVRLRVRDTGCGMDAGTLSKAFEPFFTTKPVGSGTGLGLSTVYGIVTQSGGFIDVDSRPNRGTRFDILFPTVALAPATEPPAVHPVEPRRGGTESILLVEDETVLLSLVGATLRAEGYVVIETATGRSAISRGLDTDAHIDLLVTDVILPDMSGPLVAERLTQAHPALKVLYISGYTDDHVSKSDIESGDTLLLEKPFSIGALLAKVRQSLDRP